MANGFKRALLVTGCVVLALVIVLPAMGAPLQQEPRPVIAQPEQDSAVRSVVQIIGTAVHPQFQRYELYYAPWPVPSDQAWVFIGDAKYQQQPLGLLGTWDTRAVPDGGYALRVRVVKQDGNYLDSDPTRLLVANTRPIEEPSPTPTETATPETAEPVVTQPTVAVEIVAPTVEAILPTTEPTNTPSPEVETTPEPEPTTESLVGLDLNGDDGGFSVSRLTDVARKSAMYTVGLFVALGAFFAIKAALIWVWQRIRP
jgi:hypothetical protein